MKTTAPVHTLPPKNRGEAVKKLLPLLLTYQEGRPVNVRISIARPERTQPQLRYLWGVVMTMLSEHAGYEKDDIHEYLCGAFFGWKPKRLPGNRTEQIPMRSTTVDEDGNRDVIDGDDFWRYVDFCQRFGARHGVVIPDPDPSYKLTRTK